MIANHLCIDESRKIPPYSLEDEKTVVDEFDEILRIEDRAEVGGLCMPFTVKNGREG